MSKVTALLASNNNKRGFFDDYSKEEHSLIIDATLRWSVGYLASLNLFEKIVFFADTDYYPPACQIKDTLTPIEVKACHGEYFLRLNDQYIFDKDSKLTNDEFIFSTHMDCFISKEHLSYMIEKTEKHNLVGGVNNYRHNCNPVELDGKRVPWWADQYVMANVGWLRKHNLNFSWNPCFREVQDKYLQQAKCQIKIKGQAFVPIDDPSTEYPSQGKGLSFDGFQEASLKIALKIKENKIDLNELYDCGDGQRADKDIMHLKSFFMQSPTSFKGVSNNMIVNAVILGRDAATEKLRLDSGPDKSYGRNPRLELQEIVGTSLYKDVWTDKERERFDSLLS